MSVQGAGGHSGALWRVPLGFLDSFLQYRHISPEKMRTSLTLAHPELDEWTPISLSLRVAQRTSARSTVVVLRECGHFPIDEPGISDLPQGDLGDRDPAGGMMADHSG